MDAKFLEFWGNFLLNMAKSSEQANDFARWMQSGFPNPAASYRDRTEYPDIFKMFQQFYGLDSLTRYGEEQTKVTEKALREYRESMKEYISLMGIVPRQEHLELVNKYEKLKARCADQEETIQHLKMLLGAKGTAQTDITDQYQSMIRNQGEIFQKLMKDFSRHFEDQTKKQAQPEDQTMYEKGENEDDGRVQIESDDG